MVRQPIIARCSTARMAPSWLSTSTDGTPGTGRLQTTVGMVRAIFRISPSLNRADASNMPSTTGVRRSTAARPRLPRRRRW